MENAKPIDKSKYINKTTFKKGDNRVRKPKGAVARKTKIAAFLGFKWDDLRPYMENDGLERRLAEMARLNGKDFIIAYDSLLEYVQPKLTRVDIQTNQPQQVINIFGQLPVLPPKPAIDTTPDTKATPI